MKTVRISILFFIILLSILVKSPSLKNNQTQLVNASDTVWARIINEQTPFFSDIACSMIKFYIPKSYFVKVIEVNSDSTRVIYMDNDLKVPSREGYIKTCDLLIYNQEVYNPYLNLSLKITSDEILFADTNKTYPKTILSYGDNALLYGTLTINGENFCYVYANGYIGYVRRSAFAPFEIPMHEIPLSNKISSEESEDSSILTEPTNTNSSIDSTMKIVIIVAISITCLSVIYLLFKPKNDSALKLALTQDNDDDF